MPWAMRCLSFVQISPEVSVRHQLKYLAGVTQAKDNGRFVDNSGKAMPW